MPILLALVIWWIVRRFPFCEQLMAYGGDERAVYTSGINVQVLRTGASALGGLFAGLGGLALSAVLGSADPTVAPNYTMSFLAAAEIALVAAALFGAMNAVTAVKSNVHPLLVTLGTGTALLGLVQ